MAYRVEVGFFTKAKTLIATQWSASGKHKLPKWEGWATTISNTQTFHNHQKVAYICFRLQDYRKGRFSIKTELTPRILWLPCMQWSMTFPCSAECHETCTRHMGKAPPPKFSLTFPSACLTALAEEQDSGLRFSPSGAFTLTCKGQTNLRGKDLVGES